MPRWARFVSCTMTGLLLSLTGFLAVASWWEGGQGYWLQLLGFLGRAEFWSLVWLFTLLSAGSIIGARGVVHLNGLSDGWAGLAAGSAVGLICVAFLVAAHAPDWGGLLASVARTWPDGPLFAAPVALSGAITSWLWARLD